MRNYEVSAGGLRIKHLFDFGATADWIRANPQVNKLEKWSVGFGWCEVS
jgi:hypothetical protein